MTRIIVRNLPDRVTKEKLHEIFSQKGTVTDIQLKFTKSGKFRKFAFIGYQTQEQADAAVEFLNRSYINTSRIEIEQCKGLADPEKPRSWSKHAPDSSAFKRKQEESGLEEKEAKQMKKDDKKKIKDPKLEKLLTEYKDDPMFKEFVEAVLPENNTLLEISEKENHETTEEDNTKLADKSISDLEYLKVKTGQENLTIGKDKEKEEVNDSLKDKKQPKKIKLFTVKVKGLPYKLKKSEIKAFLDVKPFTIRKALGSAGVIYVGFKTENGMKKALHKNRSFFSGKRISVKECKDEENAEDTNITNEKWEQQEAKLKNEETVAESGRIFIRNLPYVVSEDDIKALFEKFGPISDIVLPIDSFTRKPKGFGIVTFVMPEHAARAFSELDGTVFQGRMLHLLPGIDNKKEEESEDTTTNYKLKKLKKDKKNAGCSKNWNTFFVNENALAAAMADTYNTTKENVLGDTGNAAVRLALGETQIINKMKEFLEENGVCLESLNDITNCTRSKTVILVKNLPFGTKADEMRSKFAEFGELARVVLPPNGVTAIVEFIEPSEAKKAFRKVAYSKFKNVPMYLEWAPEKIFKNAPPNKVVNEGESAEKEKNEEPVKKTEEENKKGTTIFVKNLNFSTEENSLRKHFSKCGKILSVTIAYKKDPKNPGKKLSLGYGFIQFSSKQEADKALKSLQFSKLEDHTLELKRSNRVTKQDDSNFRNFAANSNKPSTKILVKNVPFQATQKEVFDLFKVFGEIKAVRLPKKMVGTGSHRGFCFIEYHTVHDAKRAFKALSQSTHLYGRRLVLEWASRDDDDVDVIRTKTAERFKTGIEKNF
ncbi:UNVERIFIED_CONTAM: hypothetical protein PYX00_005331 [Menopon gallinae]|uniref:RRM domain-containing protein n=1 Tax=Menopon gallinae TaxID=328185 RepID=A0AAW2HRJ9_9NEOP